MILKNQLQKLQDALYVTWKYNLLGFILKSISFGVYKFIKAKNWGDCIMSYKLE